MMYCGELMKRLYDMIEREANNELQEEDITLTQLKLMEFLRAREGESAMLKEIERYFDVSQATIAGIAVRLEKKGLILGYIDSNDRRVKHVRLTDAGRELCGRSKAAMDRVEEYLLGALTEDERVQLYELLGRMYKDMHYKAG